MDELAKIARKCATVDHALVALHDAGASPVLAIKALREGRGLSLTDGKKALHASPAWAVEARAAEGFHKQLCEAFDGLDEEDL